MYFGWGGLFDFAGYRFVEVMVVAFVVELLLLEVVWEGGRSVRSVFLVRVTIELVLCLCCFRVVFWVIRGEVFFVFCVLYCFSLGVYGRVFVVRGRWMVAVNFDCK